MKRLADRRVTAMLELGVYSTSQTGLISSAQVSTDYGHRRSFLIISVMGEENTLVYVQLMQPLQIKGNTEEMIVYECIEI